MSAALWAATCPAAPLAPLAGTGTQAAPPWRYAGLTHQPAPATRFDIVDVDGLRVLRVEARRSFGNLVHALPSGTRAGMLAWRARIEQPTVGADLTRRSGEDTALRVCASFELPPVRVPFFERQFLRLAQARSDEHLPMALLCYVADAALPVGTLIVSPYSRRMRSIVVARPAAGQWVTEQHDLSSDFLRAFGDESSSVPPLQAILVGADADNTGSHSLAYLDSLSLTPP